MILWLEDHLKKINNFIIKAGIYGSIAKGAISPNDCDLYLVSCLKPDTSEWLLLRKYIGQFKKDFFLQYKIPLNVVLLTVDEWHENKLFFIKNIPVVV